jgi:DNA (cytosine-5)-methyltransferase 1
MRHGSLFSGIGGFDLAAEWMGWDNVFHCEWNEFGQKILHHYWPNAIQYNDITKTDFTIHRGTIEIITGGFPCQPYSTAGKRKGKEDERHLWPQMCRAIREIQPRWVVGENVLGLVNWNGGMVFDEVQADLEAAGYEVWPYVLPAVSVGAPHRRDRIWFVAKNTNKDGWRSKEWERKAGKRQQRDFGARDYERLPANNEEAWDAADTKYSRRRKGICNKLQCEKSIRAFPFDAGVFGNAARRMSGWDQFPTQSPICGRDDGISTKLDGITFSKWRNESIKGYGNAIVPQVVYQIFKAIEEYERSTNPARHHPEAHR